MSDTIKFITPKGVAIYPKFHKPDTKWKEEGEYGTRLRLKPEDFDEKLKERLDALLEAFVEEKKGELPAGKAKKLSVRPWMTPEEDDEGEETGFVIIKASTKASGISKKTGKPWTRKLTVIDAKKRKLDPVPVVFGGSEVRLGCVAKPWYSPKDNECGLKFYLEVAQIIKLVEGGEAAVDEFGFGEEEGFDSEEAAFTAPSGGDSPAGGDEDDDF